MPDLAPQRVLHGVDLTGSAVAIAAPAAIDDPAVRALVARESAAAHAAGVQEGIQQGRAEAESVANSLATSLAQALQVAVVTSQTLHEHLAARIGGLAVDVAKTIVVGLDTENNGLITRVEQALRTVDDRPLTVNVHSADVELVRAVCPPGVEVEAANDLGRGEARVQGRWADADLTWDAVWTSVREVLDVE